MGRFLLLIVAASALQAATASMNRHHTQAAQTGSLSEAESAALARQAALSGFAVADDEVLADFGARSDRSGVSLGDAFGSYDAALTGDAAGTRVVVTGRHGAAEHRVAALYRETIEFPAAVVAHGREFRVAAGAGAVLDGSVTRPPSIPSAGWDGSVRRAVAGVASPSASVERDFRDGLGSAVGRVTGARPFVRKGAPAWVPTLLEDAERHASAHKVATFEMHGGTRGAPDAPAVVVASEGAALRSQARGYGLLVVHGPLVMEAGTRWEGLVVVVSEGDDPASVRLADRAEVYGALLLYGTEAEGDAGLPGGHFDLDVFVPGSGKNNNGHGNNCDGVDSSNPGKGKGGPNGKKNSGADPSGDVDDECKGGAAKKKGGTQTYHWDRYDDAHDVRGLDFLDGPGLGPAFQAFASEYRNRDVRVEFANASNGSGTYAIGPHTGAVRDGFSKTLRLTSLDRFEVAFDHLAELRGTNAAAVQADAAGRDRAFSVRFYDGGDLVFEVSAYADARTPRDGVSAGGSRNGLSGAFQLALEGSSAVRWAPEAVIRLRSPLPALGAAIRVERSMVAGDQ